MRVASVSPNNLVTDDTSQADANAHMRQGLTKGTRPRPRVCHPPSRQGETGNRQLKGVCIMARMERESMWRD
jgi:hypothetical protein